MGSIQIIIVYRVFKISTTIKHSTKILLAGLLFILTAKAQTNVSGGIYANTTWTKANSPYIVVDTVVVFPGVTLTIEPGVTVKFYDHTYLEIRNATLIANGTSTDSITFTSNSASPTRGSWGGSSGGIQLNSGSSATSFKYINVEYATWGIYNVEYISNLKNSNFSNNNIGLNYVSNTLIDSCNFRFNGTGISYLPGCSLNFCNISNNTITGIEDPFAATIISNCTIDSNQTGVDVSAGTFLNCSISYNQKGLISALVNNTLKNCIIEYNSILGLNLQGVHTTDSVINCEIKFNGIGLTSTSCGHTTEPPGLITQCVIEGNATGIQIGGCSNIYCNTICNNTAYDLETLYTGSPHVNNNNWCTTDSATIEAHIYDGYDNTSLGLVYFMPVDSTCSPLASINKVDDNNSITIYPNPATDYLSFNLSLNEIKIYNLIGEEKYNLKLSNRQSKINVSALKSGMYIIQMNSGDKSIWGKFVKE